MIEDCIFVYRIDEKYEGMKVFCEDLAKIVFSKDNVDKQFDNLKDHLMRLPPHYLDFVGYGAAHSKKSEFKIRMMYIKSNENDLDDEMKGSIVKACNMNELNSDEMKEIEELNVLEDEEMMELYRRALKGKEENEIPKEEEALKKKALKRADELLKKQPELISKTEILWSDRGAGSNFAMLCELLKANSIPTRLLDLRGDIE